MKRTVKYLLSLYCTIAVLFASTTWALMLVDGISPKELSKCLDPRALFHTSNSR